MQTEHVWETHTFLRYFLTMLWWEKEFPEAGWDIALCLELLKTSGWAREGAWDDSRFGDSFSIEEGVFPSRTARSILGKEGRYPPRLTQALSRPALPLQQYSTFSLPSYSLHKLNGSAGH